MVRETKTGTNYWIVGAADCQYFARAERIALLLRSLLNLDKKDLEIHTKHPDEWVSFFKEECNRLEFQDYEEEVKERGAKAGRVLVYNHMTGRLVGGSKAFGREVSKIYGIKCDLNNAQLSLIAQENLLLHTNATKTTAYRADLQKRKKLQLGILGGRGTFVDTHCAKLAKHFGLSTITPDRLVMEQVKANPNSALTETIKFMIRDTGTVSDEVYTELIEIAVEKESNKGRGWVLINYPRTPAQAQLLDDNDIDLQLLLVLTASEDTLFDRRREDISEEKMKVYIRKWTATAEAIVRGELKTVVIDCTPAIATVTAACTTAIKDLFAQVCLEPAWTGGKELPASVETAHIGATADAVAAKLRAEQRAAEKAVAEAAAAEAAAEVEAKANEIKNAQRTEDDKRQLAKDTGSFWDVINPEGKESLPVEDVKAALRKADEEINPKAKEWVKYLEERLRNHLPEAVMTKDLFCSTLEYMTALAADAVAVAAWETFDRKKFKEFYSLRDVNENGELSMDELKLLMLHLGFEATVANEMMKCTDTDGSGTIDFPELCTAFKMVFLISETFDREDFKMEFEKFDPEATGAIPSDKLGEFLSVYGYKLDIDTTALLAIADKDATGSCQFDLLCEAYVSVFGIESEAFEKSDPVVDPKEALEAALEVEAYLTKVFHSMDYDNSGTVSRRELHQKLDADEEIEQLLVAAGMDRHNALGKLDSEQVSLDKNGRPQSRRDGGISLKEFLGALVYKLSHKPEFMESLHKPLEPEATVTVTPSESESS